MPAPRKLITSSNAPAGFQVVDLEEDDRVSYDALLNANAHAGWLEKHDPKLGGCVRIIGTRATTLKQQLEVRKTWNDITRNRRLAEITLDTDPEIPGRPEARRPGVPAVIMCDTTGWGEQSGNVAAIYHIPRSTFLADDRSLDNPGGVKELASYDGSSAYAILYYAHMGLDELDEWVREGRDAVRSVAIGRTHGDPELEAELAADERIARNAAELRRIAAL